MSNWTGFTLISVQIEPEAAIMAELAGLPIPMHQYLRKNQTEEHYAVDELRQACPIRPGQYPP